MHHNTDMMMTNVPPPHRHDGERVSTAAEQLATVVGEVAAEVKEGGGGPKPGPAAVGTSPVASSASGKSRNVCMRVCLYA